MKLYDNWICLWTIFFLLECLHTYQNSDLGYRCCAVRHFFTTQIRNSHPYSCNRIVKNQQSRNEWKYDLNDKTIHSNGRISGNANKFVNIKMSKIEVNLEHVIITKFWTRIKKNRRSSWNLWFAINFCKRIFIAKQIER